MKLANHARAALMVLGAVSLLLLAGCENRNASAGTSEIARSQNIEPVKANSLIAQDNSIAIIDVRTPDEFSGGHVKNAINIDFHDPNFTNSIASLQKDKTYVVYCRSGNRSGQAMSVFQNAGIAKVYNISGGIGRWTSVGLPN